MVLFWFFYFYVYQSLFYTLPRFIETWSLLTPISLVSFLIMSSHLCLSLPRGLFPVSLPDKFWNLYYFLSFWLHSLPILLFYIQLPSHHICHQVSHSLYIDWAVSQICFISPQVQSSLKQFSRLHCHSLATNEMNGWMNGWMGGWTINYLHQRQRKLAHENKWCNDIQATEGLGKSTKHSDSVCNTSSRQPVCTNHKMT